MGVEAEVSIAAPEFPVESADGESMRLFSALAAFNTDFGRLLLFLRSIEGEGATGARNGNAAGVGVEGTEDALLVCCSFADFDLGLEGGMQSRAARVNEEQKHYQ
jgi:hypothetical protein